MVLFASVLCIFLFVLHIRCYCKPPYFAISHQPQSCLQRQAVLQQLSASQTIHLDPLVNAWCQKMTLSSEVLHELGENYYPKFSSDWSSVFAKVLMKISAAMEASKEWLTPFSPPESKINYHLFTILFLF
ncbi:unnamed protein product, partial [Dicrocoelium dendriticum]